MNDKNYPNFYIFTGVIGVVGVMWFTDLGFYYYIFLGVMNLSSTEGSSYFFTVGSNDTGLDSSSYSEEKCLISVVN